MAGAGLGAFGEDGVPPTIGAIGRTILAEVEINKRMAEGATIAADRGGFHGYGFNGFHRHFTFMFGAPDWRKGMLTAPPPG